MTNTPLDLYSEPYGSTGNIGTNFRRLLGAPSTDQLHTVIRESVQNIADAAKTGIGPKVVFRLRNLEPNQLAALSSSVFAELPDENESRKQLNRFLNRESPVVLEICDFGTVGLGGPTRADRIPIDVTQTDFIDFLRNIGSARDTKQGGGTYGFGKVALYKSSLCSTILVDTQPISETECRRLIGCHVGLSFERPEDGMKRRFTGRHWWGINDSSDEIVDPMQGEDAAKMASCIGFLERDEKQTGTSIMILDFDTDGKGLEYLGARIVEAMLWNFWPRMMNDTPDDKRFDVSVEVNGKFLRIPSPDEFAPLELFAKALRGIRSNDTEHIRTISSKRPVAKLGKLSIIEGLRAKREAITPGSTLFPDPLRHIALMRPVELVIKYLEGEPLPDERIEWAGVFMTSDVDEIEQAFADSEPPAHDDWVSDSLPVPAKTYVNVALRELKYFANQQGGSEQVVSSGESSGPPLAKVAGRLGAALEGVGGDGAMRRSSGSRGKNGNVKPKTARATPPVFRKLAYENGCVVAIFRTEVRQDKNHSGVKLIVAAGVAIEGSSIGHVDEISEYPEILSLENLGTGETVTSSGIDLNGTEAEYEIRVSMPKNSAIVVNAHVESI